MQIQLDVRIARILAADWFRRLAGEAGLSLKQYGTSGEAFTLGAPNEFNVLAKFESQPPYLTFVASDSSRQGLVDTLAQKAVARVASGDLGGVLWHSASLSVHGLQFASPFSLAPLLQQLGSQTRIVGWRRLGWNVLLEFTENLPAEGSESNAIFAPNAIVHVHIAVPAPCPGHFSSHISHSALEVVAAICTFALGRGVELPPSLFPSKPEQTVGLIEKQMDTSVLTLARKSVPLDIFSSISMPGGYDHFTRMRAAFLTFDAALQQRHDSVACILYVVAAEVLAAPNAPWRDAKLTKRFIEFFRELIPNELDEIIGHGNFESVFGIRRGRRSNSALRRELLTQIYDFRSGHVHAGLRPSYRGFVSSFGSSDNIRRSLFTDFAEAAILGYLVSPRSSVIGHPSLDANRSEQCE